MGQRIRDIDQTVGGEHVLSDSTDTMEGDDRDVCVISMLAALCSITWERGWEASVRLARLERGAPRRANIPGLTEAAPVAARGGLEHWRGG